MSTCGTGVHSPLVVLRHPPRMSIYKECARGRENISCIMPSQQWKPCVILVVFSPSILYTTAWASQHRCSLVAEGSTKSKSLDLSHTKSSSHPKVYLRPLLSIATPSLKKKPSRGVGPTTLQRQSERVDGPAVTDVLTVLYTLVFSLT